MLGDRSRRFDGEWKIHRTSEGGTRLLCERRHHVDGKRPYACVDWNTILNAPEGFNFHDTFRHAAIDFYGEDAEDQIREAGRDALKAYDRETFGTDDGSP